MAYDLSLYRLTDEEKLELASAELALEDLTKRKVPLVKAVDHGGLASFALESLHQVWLGRSLDVDQQAREIVFGKRELLPIVVRGGSPER